MTCWKNRGTMVKGKSRKQTDNWKIQMNLPEIMIHQLKEVRVIPCEIT